MVSRLQALGLSLLVLYFAFHAFAGEKGLGRWTDSQIELETRVLAKLPVDAEVEFEPDDKEAVLASNARATESGASCRTKRCT